VRLLHLTPELPFAPGGTGGSTRQFHLLRRLVERGHDVTAVAPVARDQREGAQRLREAGVDLRAVARPPSRVRETAWTLAAHPALLARAAQVPLLAWQVDVFWSRLRRLAAAAVTERCPDVILVEHDWAAAWHRDLPPGVPRALVLHNLSWRYYEARARTAGGARAAALRIEARRFTRFDRMHLHAYDLLVTMSEEERAPLADLVSTPSIAVPNGVDARALEPAPAASGPPTLLFTGTLDYPPNGEALLWLLREVWPRIAAAVPEARLHVVGRNPPEAARRLAGHGVTLTGFVPELAPWFAGADVVLVPLRSGAGTKLKLLDGLASGRPVVSTPVGVEGIDAEHGRHLLVASEADAFAGAAIGLLRDPAQRQSLAAAGRSLAESRYDWRALGDRLEAALLALA
jgi:glycosyltransferase involved in cell wall biosynthesis